MNACRQQQLKYVQKQLRDKMSRIPLWTRCVCIILISRDGIFKLSWRLGIDSKKSIPLGYVACAGIL
jgi:hypothetical protein